MYSKTNILSFLLKNCLQSERIKINLRLLPQIILLNAIKLWFRAMNPHLFLQKLYDHFVFISSAFQLYRESIPIQDYLFNTMQNKTHTDIKYISNNYTCFYKKWKHKYLENPENWKVNNSKKPVE